MKAGWEVRALGEVCTVLSGFAFKSEDYCEAGHFLVRIGNVQDGALVLDNPRFVEIDHKTKRFELSEGDILTSLTGNIGRVAVVQEEHLPAALNQRVAKITPNCPEKMLASYLMHFLTSDAFGEPLREQSHGAAQQNVSPKAISDLQIPLPPLDEQKRIVEVLDAAFEGLSRARAHTETNLQNTRELFLRSIECDFELMAETHERQTVGEIATIKGGKRLPKGEKTVATETPFPYISIKDFNEQGSVDVAGIDYLLPATRDAIKNYIIRSEDLYISIAGTIGKTGIVPPELDGANLTENAARMVFKEGINNEYVYFFTLTADFQDQAGLNTRTAAQPKLALERLKTISIPIVPLVEQIEMASKFRTLREQTQQAEAHYRAKLADLDDLRQSLLQKAFAGELT